MVKRPEFALLIVGCGLIQSGHQFYYIFGTKLWIDELGISATAAGWLFALGAIMEALFLMLVHIGKQPVSIGGGVKYYVESPGGGPDWGLRLNLTFLFPK